MATLPVPIPWRRHPPAWDLRIMLPLPSDHPLIKHGLPLQFTSSLLQEDQALPLLAGRNYRCQCGQPVFFRNSICLACHTPLGYDCERGLLLSLVPGMQPHTWLEWTASRAPEVPGDTQRPPDLRDIPGQELPQHVKPLQGQQQPYRPPQQQQQQPQQQQFQQDSQAQFESQDQSQSLLPLEPQGQAGLPQTIDLAGSVYKRCLNLSTPASCNWLVGVSDSHAMCRACRLNRTIPDLTDPAFPDNGYLWGLVEQAKRRLVSALVILRLPAKSRMTEDPQHGVMFDFLRSPLNGPHVVTGHNTGLITLNVDEADDAKREAVRKAMREPYRTLVGHFRHEVGHYYWDRLIRGTSWMNGFRQLFGDETANYAASLKRNYDDGPPSDWPLHFVSAYASTHPWEDWAECWAHYLHMRDAIDTALSFGLSVDKLDLEFTAFTLDALYQPDHCDAVQFLAFLNHWTRLTTMLNEMSRSMGQPDFYPFVLPLEVVAKLHFIHIVVSSQSWLLEDAPLAPAPLGGAAPLDASSGNRSSSHDFTAGNNLAYAVMPATDKH